MKYDNMDETNQSQQRNIYQINETLFMNEINHKHVMVGIFDWPITKKKKRVYSSFGQSQNRYVVISSFEEFI